MQKKYNKVLLLGSGALSIGQAGEFDYSGSQALKALSEEGIHVVIINPNIATVQTNPGEGKTVYLTPLEFEHIVPIIEKERPQGIVATCGGQTAINCLLQLNENKILEKYNIDILGPSIDTLIKAEDRDLFKELVQRINLPVIESNAVSNVEQALEIAPQLGFPIIVRAAFALGGLGSGFAHSMEELLPIVEKAFSYSPQVLLEKSLAGWKEVEYEVMRDAYNNCITICNMENFDPLGVHTGDSIVVAPSQTLDDIQYQILRNASIKIVSELKVVGECNVQFALDPNSNQFYVIEVNPRLSRSSALASKATGYPIAYVSTKVGLGYSLAELKNPVTQKTSALYEPCLDYLALKVPRWDLSKFKGVSRSLGSAMKSVGEIMAIGRNFQEVLQKSLRMVFETEDFITENKFENLSLPKLLEDIRKPTDTRILKIIAAFRNNATVEEIFQITKITKWFLWEIKEMLDHVTTIENSISGEDQILSENLRAWKLAGFSDESIAGLIRKKTNSNISYKDIRQQRIKTGVIPVVKKIDTTSGVFDTPSNYLYFTYDGRENDLNLSQDDKSVIVLGGGPYRIGSSVEFDWCAVSSVEEIHESGLQSVMINCNPETVSTDYNSSDRLYFEEMTLERVLDIFDFESGAIGIITCMGGQNPNNLTPKLADNEIPLLGHPYKSIEIAEGRFEFSNILNKLNIEQPAFAKVSSEQQAYDFIKNHGFPVMIRPGFVLSGTGMRVAYTQKSLELYLNQYGPIPQDSPLLFTKYIEDANEIEVDGVCSNGKVIEFYISEHLENAGVHSGDATLIFPTQFLDQECKKEIKEITAKIIESLNLNGPFNIQYLVKNNTIYVIELNSRASRSFPFISKMAGTNLAKNAIRIIMNNYDMVVQKQDNTSFVGIKAPMFSFKRLDGADPTLGVEMMSTGEVGCLGKTFDEALLNSLISTGFRIPKKGILISSGKNKDAILESISHLKELNLPIYTTEGTGIHLAKNGLPCKILSWPGQGESDVIDAIKRNEVDLVINIPKNQDNQELEYDFQIRQSALRTGKTIITNSQVANKYISAINNLRKNKDQFFNYIPLN